MWHTENDVFALVIFVIMLIKSLRTPGGADRQQKALIAVLIVSIASCIVDFLSSTEMNLNNNWLLYSVLLTAYYALMPMVAAAWIVYMLLLISEDDPALLRRRIILALLPVVLYSAIALTNPLNGAFFTLSKQMEYSRGPLFWSLAVGFYSVYSLAGLIILVINRKKVTPKSNMLFLSTFFISSILIPLLQSAHPGLLIAEISYAVLYILCDATVEEEKRNNLMCRIQEQNAVLRDAVDAANSASSAKTDFLSRMSHDIRTPLNGIIGMTYLTQKMELPEAAQSNLKKIETSSKFLLSLINDILDMSKLESQKIELHPEPYPFDEFCAYIDAVIRPLCDEKQQTFLMDTDPIAECTPVVDINWLNRIYFNLLSNAVKCTPEGGTITLKIREKRLEEEKIQFTVSVTDNGIGMSSEFQKHLFEPFTQENRSDTSEMRGTGLGLAIVKRAVDAMGGTLSVKSEKGRGSCFTAVVVSPCVKRIVLSQPNAEAGQDKGEEFACLDGKHVLLCEDHPLNQEIAKALLEEKKMFVQIAEDGQKAVEIFSKSPVKYFDFILMDVRMPVLDGMAATRKIRSLNRVDAKKVPILAMTADAFTEDVQKCRDAGMDGHVAKPIEPAALYDTLAGIISE